MKPGPHPKPHSLKVLEGRAKPAPRGGRRSAIPAPDNLSPGARQIWDCVASELASRGVLEPMDVPILRNYCTVMALAEDAEATLLTEGLVVTGHRGALRKHPVFQVYRDLLSTGRQYACELGLTPSARTRVPVREPEEEPDALEQILRGQA